MSSGNEERIAKYSAWIAELKSRAVNLEGQREKTKRVVPIVLVVSLVGFVFGAWFGVATLFTGIMIAVASTYLTIVRKYELDVELKRTERELERLRAG